MKHLLKLIVTFSIFVEFRCTELETVFSVPDNQITREYFTQSSNEQASTAFSYDIKDTDNERQSVFPNACGKKNENRIVGGRITTRHEFPWMVLVIIDLEIKNGTPQFTQCAGTIISSRFIMTGAQCITDQTTGASKVRNIEVLIGSYNIKKGLNNALFGGPKDGQLVIVDQVYFHPAYNYRTQENDVALIRLPDHIPFSKNVQPVCLCDDPNFNLVGKTAIVTGWGKATETSEVASPVLRKVFLPIIKNEQCKKAYPPTPDFPSITGCMLCTGTGSQGGKGTCDGDSGGPLLVKKNGIFYQCGIISFGRIPCGEKGSPDVYTRVGCPAVYNWIRSTVINNSKGNSTRPVPIGGRQINGI